MNEKSYDPTDREILASYFACASSAPLILMRTWFLGPKKPRKGCALDLRKYSISNTYISHFLRSTSGVLFHTTANKFFLCSIAIQPLGLHLTMIPLGSCSLGTVLQFRIKYVGTLPLPANANNMMVNHIF